MIQVININKVGSNCDFEYIGRPGKGVKSSPLGNKFNSGNRSKDIADYRIWLHAQIQKRNPKVIAELSRLKAIAISGDLVLGCFCKPLACHGDVIKSAIEWCIAQGGAK